MSAMSFLNHPSSPHAHYTRPPDMFKCPACRSAEDVLTWAKCPDGRIMNWVCARCFLFAQVPIPEDGVIRNETILEEIHGQNRAREKAKADRKARAIRKRPEKATRATDGSSRGNGR